MKALLIFGSVLLSWYVFGGICPPARCQDHNHLASLVRYIEYKLERDNIPGLAACIVRQDSIVWSGEFGFQTLSDSIPMTLHSVTGIASITKLIVATAILQLIERKALDLHTRVNALLPFAIRHPDHPEDESQLPSC